MAMIRDKDWKGFLVFSRDRTVLSKNGMAGGNLARHAQKARERTSTPESNSEEADDDGVLHC